MPWPSAHDYRMAVMNPGGAFSDPSLRQSTPVSNGGGLPLIWNGTYASVFKLRHVNGTFDAVRCFTRRVTDQNRRYDLISKHLRKFSSPYLVKFKYIHNKDKDDNPIKDGIKTNGEWYPIVMMTWVEGKRLDGFVAEHLNESDTLNNLAAQWRGLVSSLCGARMAHGDLQHGNVMVDTNGGLKLVDYDGMYIPTFAGESSPENGHANYQHPQRTLQHYGPYIDNFSTLVIYLSLLALAADPDLWQDFYMDDNLILTRDDYNDPQSPCFKRLKQINPDVAMLAEILEYCCKEEDITKVPYLEDVLQGWILPDKCTQCGTKIPAGDKLCSSCANKNKCTKCGTKIPSGDTLCPSCANKNKCTKCGKRIPAGDTLCSSCAYTGQTVNIRYYIKRGNPPVLHLDADANIDKIPRIELVRFDGKNIPETIINHPVAWDSQKDIKLENGTHEAPIEWIHAPCRVGDHVALFLYDMKQAEWLKLVPPKDMGKLRL